MAIKYFKISDLSAIGDDELDNNDLLLVADKSNQKNGLSAYTRNLNIGGLQSFISRQIAKTINAKTPTSIGHEDIVDAIDDRFTYDIEHTILNAGNSVIENN